jgi:hypothetical protein
MAEGLVSTPTLFGAGVVAGAIGFGAGYFFAKKRLETKYEKIAKDEIAEMRIYFLHQQKATEARLKAPITEVVEYLGYKKAEEAEKVEETPAIEEPVENAFETKPTDGFVWDYKVEKDRRAANPGKPYVVHLDEYGEEGYDTVCYTFYDEDEILANERDEVIDNVDELVGLENLQRFGQGTGNVNIVLIRNEALTMDIEIARANGSYAADVHGFLQHNFEKMPRRHQGFDDEQTE